MSDEKKRILWLESGDEGLNLAVTFPLELAGYDVVSYSIPPNETEVQTIERIGNDIKPTLVIAKVDENFNDYGHTFCSLMRDNHQTANIGILFIYPLTIIDIDRETAQKLCWPDEILQWPFGNREFQTHVEKLIDKYEVNRT